MRWQRVAQAAIAVFVIGFIAVLATTLRRERRTPADQPAATRTHEKAPFENPGGGTHEVSDPSGKALWSVKFGSHVSLEDGRQQLSGGVTATINRPNGQFIVTSRDAEITPADDGIKQATFKNDVRVTGTGLEVRGGEAHYTQADGMMIVPGPVTFSKGRMTGSGVGATYDQTREVFWIQQNAVVDVAPAGDGTGALAATAGTIGMARREHYVRMQRSARISGEARIAEADEIVILLTEDDERVRALELRGNSRITSTSATSQSMSARDIDMTYAEDGRTLRQSRLVENAVVQLPPPAGSTAGKRIAAQTIDMSLGPDGSTITGLMANQSVQLNLPAEGDGPAKDIRSATLNGTGSDAGLQSATFAGGVEFRETRAARGKLAAIDRTATSQTLIVDTKPGLGAIQKADFRGNVKFTEPPDFVAQAQQGIYDIARDRLDLTSAAGQPGPPSPTVSDGRVAVDARTIQFGLSTRELIADTRVRSTIRPQKDRKSGGGRVPSVLADDQPVNVTSNRLEYKGRDSAAVYTGSVTLWQGKDTSIKGDTITIDDRTGNLSANGNVTTAFLVQDSAAKDQAPKSVPTTGTAESFLYEDAKRLATYTGKAHIVGAQGDLVGQKIELFLKAGSNELERVEGYGANGEVQVREGKRIAKGSHLTYTSADDLYLMIGAPVDITEEKDGKCTRTLAATARFNRTTDQARVEGSPSGKIPFRSETLAACPAGLGR
jgi:lipopolysaccharide transport protein LptA